MFKYVFSSEPVPEWGLAPAVSTAVPIAPSGIEIKSTRDASDAMYTILRSRVDKDAVASLRKFVARAKRSTGTGARAGGGSRQKKGTSYSRAAVLSRGVRAKKYSKKRK